MYACMHTCHECTPHCSHCLQVEWVQIYVLLARLDYWATEQPLLAAAFLPLLANNTMLRDRDATGLLNCSAQARKKPLIWSCFRPARRGARALCSDGGPGGCAGEPDRPPRSPGGSTV